MEHYYAQQASNSMPYFSGHYRQRGSGFGELAAGIGRVAFPIARKIIWPAAKKIGRELIAQAAPELLDVVTKKQSAKQALRNTVTKTARKHLGGAHFAKRKRANQKKPTISRKHIAKRSRSDFFSNVKNAK